MKYTTLALMLTVLLGCASEPYKQYEWYKDTYGSHTSNVAKIRVNKTLIVNTTDQTELQRLLVELSALQHICIENVNRYNSESTKTIKNVVLPYDVPLSLSVEDCT